MTQFEMGIILSSFLLEFIISLGALVAVYVSLTNTQTKHSVEIENLKTENSEMKQNFKDAVDEIRQDVKDVKNILMKDFVHLGNR